TAGFSNARTGVNAHMGDFRPPLKLVRTIPLSGIKYPGVLMAFDDFLLVGAESYDEGELNDAGRYQLLDRQSGEVRWEQTLPGRGIGNWLPDYEPAYAHDIVLLAGPATTAAKAVRVSTGEILWSDDTISDRSGRSPLISDGVVVYSGADRVVAAELETGEVLWQIDVETAPAPLCSIGDLVFWLDRERVVHAVRLRTGEEQWRSGPAPGTPFPFDVANLVASDSYLFVNMYRSGLSSGAGSVVQALDRKDGHVVWSLERPYEYVSKLLLAYDRLYVMEEEMGLVSTSHLAAYDPDVGSLLWKIDLSTHGGPNGMAPIPSLWGSGIGNEVLYYLDYARGSILARNALTGTVLGRWGSNDGVTADLCLADGQLLILGARTLEIYEPSHGIFFAHIADGGGQTTLLTLTNISSAPTTGSVHFLNDEGEPLSVVIEGQEASMSTVPFSIPARAIQTTGGSEVQSGWARAEADQPIRGSSIFQYSGNGLYSEAGVADARASGETSVFVERDGKVSTAVAIAAPVGGGRWEMTLRLLDQEGLELASRSIWISYGNHLAQFIEELFPDEVGDSFQGTLAIESPFPVVVTALRTKNGIQLSSYPAAPTGQ
ncbi:MAG: PQQ-binding-like beta-propeller repeat protein, partial [Acidobacteriota bacterium]